MSYDPSEPDLPGAPAPRSSVRERVKLPAIFLMIVGAINLLWAGYQFFEGIRAVMLTPEEIREVQKTTAEALKQLGLPEQGAFAQDPQAVKTQSILQGFGIGALALIAALLSLIGGLRMSQLRSYGLAVSGAIAAAIPCVSCMGCCGVGEVVGIWAVVVLMNEEVRRAFQ